MRVTGHIARNFQLYFWGAIVALLMSISSIYQYATIESEVVKIDSKERICDGGKEGGCYYLIFTDKGAYKNSDAFFHFKFDSSEVQAKLKVGETYEITTYGWRVPFFSMYENVVALEATNE